MRNRLFSMTLVSVAVCMLAPPIHAAPRPKPGYDSFIVGNPADASPPPGLSSGLVLMGGGLDVDEAYQWMCQRAGGGDFVVIRTTGTDAYNPYIQQLCPQMDSVETIIITTVAGANSQYVTDQIHHAEALWIAGGDQSTYVQPVAGDGRPDRSQLSAQFQGSAGGRHQRGAGGAEPVHLYR